MSEKEKKIVLAIFAHPDDELGVAGTLANHSENGDDVYLAFLTYGENATTITGTAPTVKERRIEHANKIAELLGVHIKYVGLPDSKIEYNVESAYKVAELIREVKPDIIISWNKTYRLGSGHPDHRKTHDLVYDAINYARYKNGSSGFEPFRKRYSFYIYFDPSAPRIGQIVYVDVSDQIDKIRDFIKIYKDAYGDWPVKEYKFGALSYYGRISRVEYAEVFEQVLSNDSVPKYLD